VADAADDLDPSRKHPRADAVNVREITAALDPAVVIEGSREDEHRSERLRAAVDRDRHSLNGRDPEPCQPVGCDAGEIDGTGATEAVSRQDDKRHGSVPVAGAKEMKTAGARRRTSPAGPMIPIHDPDDGCRPTAFGRHCFWS